MRFCFCELHNKWPFSIEDRHFSGAILHYLCIFNGKLKKQVAIQCERSLLMFTVFRLFFDCFSTVF